MVRTSPAVRAIEILPPLTQDRIAGRRIDLFICAKGFEERVQHAPGQLLSNGEGVTFGVLLGEYTTNLSDNDSRAKTLLPLLERLSSRPIRRFCADSPEETSAAIDAALYAADLPSEVNVAFDISGASSLLIFSVIGALARSTRTIHLEIIYVTANRYFEPSPIPEEADAFVCAPESGVSQIVANSMFSGHHHDHLPHKSIVFPTLDSERLISCLSKIGVGHSLDAPDSVFWILPTTTSSEHAWRQDKVKDALRRQAETIEDGAIPSRTFPSHFIHCDVLDFRMACRIVIEQIDKLAGSNISLVHMGTKIQSVGAALALCIRGEVALVSARPKSFNANHYSDGIGIMHSIQLGSLASALEALRCIGDLEVVGRTP